ncbi:hypothetical protein RDI58_018699 [Solanum bulbocastanum]|uniref:Uncharacterized protein n=1 Tax=Solanum bulbocastanum TaxID=147425 RepID=A0AAN8YA01_SOLBU
MFAEQRLCFPILLFIYLFLCSSCFVTSQSLLVQNISLSNSPAGVAGLSSL